MEFFGMDGKALKESEGGTDLLIGILQDASMCGAQVIQKHKIGEEVKQLMQYVFSDEWLEIVEGGIKSEFDTELAASIDSMTTKVMGITGDEFVSSMSYEMGEWIKDTSILWIKNKGAGNTTTEAEILKLREMNQRNKEIEAVKKRYEDKINT